MTPVPVSRKSPRAPIDEPGMLTVRTREQHRRVPVAIRSISCEGAGLALRDRAQRVERRTTIRMDFTIDGRPFEIPGLVVWVADGAAPEGTLDVGVRFLLAAVTHETRQAYARWVVEILRRNALAPVARRATP